MPESKSQLKLAYAVIDGTAKDSKMSIEAAREIVRASKRMSETELRALPKHTPKKNGG